MIAEKRKLFFSCRSTRQHVPTVNSTVWTRCSQCLDSTLDNLHLRFLLDVA